MSIVNQQLFEAKGLFWCSNSFSFIVEAVQVAIFAVHHNCIAPQKQFIIKAKVSCLQDQLNMSKIATSWKRLTWQAQFDLLQHVRRRLQKHQILGQKKTNTLKHKCFFLVHAMQTYFDGKMCSEKQGLYSLYTKITNLANKAVRPEVFPKTRNFT